MEPRATPAARLALGANFFRAALFAFLRSVLSVIVLVFIVFVGSAESPQPFFNPAYFSTSFFSP
jgi:hypothetical protein